jgi:hypothetical protein
MPVEMLGTPPLVLRIQLETLSTRALAPYSLVTTLELELEEGWEVSKTRALPINRVYIWDVEEMVVP